MKLKYYLNGFGIGVIFATVILSVSFFVNQNNRQAKPMTDAQIIEYAKGLGMVEATTKPGGQTSASESVSANPQPEQSDSGEYTTEGEPVTEPDTEAQTTGAETETQPEASQSGDYTGERITIQIKSGMTSDSVARILAENGVIESAPEFDSFMVREGYSSRISTGTYELETGMEFSEIADKICR